MSDGGDWKAEKMGKRHTPFRVAFAAALAFALDLLALGPIDFFAVNRFSKDQNLQLDNFFWQHNWKPALIHEVKQPDRQLKMFLLKFEEISTHLSLCLSAPSLSFLIADEGLYRGHLAIEQ